MHSLLGRVILEPSITLPSSAPSFAKTQGCGGKAGSVNVMHALTNYLSSCLKQIHGIFLRVCILPTHGGGRQNEEGQLEVA